MKMAMQMDLGTLVDTVRNAPKGTIVVTDTGESVSNPHSYRGYYEQASIEPSSTGQTLSEDFAAELDAFIDTEAEGWKGGEFYMDSDTPVWISPEGTYTGRALVGIEMDGNVMVLMTEEID